MPEQVWAVRCADRDVQVRDLPVGVLADIAKKYDVSWLLVQATPLMDAEVATAVVHAIHDQAGVSHPENLTGRTLMDCFVRVDDDLPDEFVDGVPPEAADL